MDGLKNSLLKSIQDDLANNYNSKDISVLKTLLDDVIANALFYSKRKETDDNLKLLSLEIKECVKKIYLRRGAEETSSLSESGKNSVYIDAIAELRSNILKNGKRAYF